jgi:uncharacterized protein (TIGR02246 family)
MALVNMPFVAMMAVKRVPLNLSINFDLKRQASSIFYSIRGRGTMNSLKSIGLTVLTLSIVLHCSAQTERSNSEAVVREQATNVNRERASQSTELAAARRAVEEGNARWSAAWARGDAESVAATFTTDGSLLAQGGRVIRGRQRLLEYVRDWMRRFGGSARLNVTTTDLWLNGNTAYETGIARYEYTVNNQPMNIERRYFTIWRQQRNHSWKIFMDVGVPLNQAAAKSGTADANGKKL